MVQRNSQKNSKKLPQKKVPHKTQKQLQKEVPLDRPVNRVPRVCFCGRPNVGKSSLFNRLIGRKKALVLDQPGVTRDVSTIEVNWADLQIELADLAGLELKALESPHHSPRSSRLSSEASAELQKLSMQAAMSYLRESDLVLFVVDARSPLTPVDEEVARLVRSSRVPVQVVLSKVESSTVEDQGLVEASALGWNAPVATSAEHNRGIEDLKELIVSLLKERGFQSTIPQAEIPEVNPEESPLAEEDSEIVHNSSPERGLSQERPITLGVYGRPNVGKSTLVNYLLGNQRMITSSIAGTTIDSVDSDFKMNDRFYRIVDTAGIRRRSKTEKGVEVLSVLQALRSLDRVDVALFLVDGYEGVTDQDEKVAGELLKAGRPVVIVVNKWDLCRVDKKDYGTRLREAMPFLGFAPLVFTSAEKHRGLEDLFGLIDEILKQRYALAPTGELNRILKSCEKRNNPRDARIYFSVQTSKNPPTITIQVNDPKKIHFAFERYLANELRATFGWMGSPLKLVFKSKR